MLFLFTCKTSKTISIGAHSFKLRGGIQTAKRLRKSKGIEKRSDSLAFDDIMLKAFLSGEMITADDARGVPSLYAGISYIAGLISMLPVKLYSEADGRTHPLNDYRVALLNDDTGDLLNGMQLKAALVEDYILHGSGYAFVNWTGNKIKSINYVQKEFVSVMKNNDQIFKTATFMVQGNVIEDYRMLRILKDSRDGVTGKGLLNACNDVLKVARDLLSYEKVLAKTGGNKKGFLASKSKLTDAAMDNVKKAWSKLWNSPECTAMVLNDGMNFIEASATSVEQQLDERKKNNYNEISKLLNLPPSVLEGTASENVWRQTVTSSIMPIIVSFETAFNSALLLECEKGSKYFAIDTDELVRGDMKTRFEAYAIAAKEGFMQIDEIRYRENLPSIGFDLIRLGLQDVYFDPRTKEIYTPNTNKSFKLQGGSENGELDKE